MPWIFDDRFQPTPGELDPRFQPVATIAQAPYLILPATQAGATNVSLIPLSGADEITMNRTRIRVSDTAIKPLSAVKVNYFY